MLITAVRPRIWPFLNSSRVSTCAFGNAFRACFSVAVFSFDGSPLTLSSVNSVVVGRERAVERRLGDCYLTERRTALRLVEDADDVQLQARARRRLHPQRRTDRELMVVGVLLLDDAPVAPSCAGTLPDPADHFMRTVCGRFASTPFHRDRLARREACPEPSGSRRRPPHRVSARQPKRPCSSTDGP